VLLGVVLLNEEFGVHTVAGFALVAVGCWLSTRPSRPAASAPADSVAFTDIPQPSHDRFRSAVTDAGRPDLQRTDA
jgi:hypothetical protein